MFENCCESIKKDTSPRAVMLRRTGRMSIWTSRTTATDPMWMFSMSPTNCSTCFVTGSKVPYARIMPMLFCPDATELEGVQTRHMFIGSQSVGFKYIFSTPRKRNVMTVRGKRGAILRALLSSQKPQKHQSCCRIRQTNIARTVPRDHFLRHKTNNGDC